MDKIELVCIVIIAGCMFGLGWITNSSKVQCTIPQFQQIATDFAKQHTYSSAYDCVNFSDDLVKVYQTNGYDAKVVSGWLSSGSYCKVNNSSIKGIPNDSILNTSCAGAHSWVEVTVPIDAITGEIVKES
jgi:hypothetical protein